MTIYTTESASEKKDLIESGFELDIECPEQKALATKDEYEVDYPVYNDPVVPIRYQRRPPKRRICLQICLFAGIVVGLSVSMLASLYLYRSMSRLRYRGRCGVGIAQMPRGNMTAQPEASAYSGADYMLEEDVDIDDMIEKIKVPKRDHYREALFTHDFHKNLTALRDEASSQCYLLPLLSKDQIPDPQRFVDALKSMQEKESFPRYPEQSFRYWMNKMNDDMDDLYDDLKTLCGDYVPYFGSLLQTTTTTTTTEAPSRELPSLPFERYYHEYAGGDAIISYQIIFTEP